MVLPLFTIPWSVNYLGSERFGMWIAATSLMPLLAFFGGGVGNSLLNAVSRAHAQADNQKLRVVVGTALAMTMFLAALVLTIGLIAAYALPWGNLLGLKSPVALAEVRAVIATVIVAIALGFLTNIGTKVRTGLQQIPAVAALEILGTIVVLPVLLLAIHQQMSTAWLVAAVVLVPLIVKGAGYAIFFINNPGLRPGSSDIDPRVARDLAAGSGMFLVTTIAHGVAVASDNLLIANIIGAHAVSDYSIVLRLFMIPLFVASFVYGAQWPVYAEAAAKNELAWIRKTFFRTISIAALSAVIMSATMFWLVDEILVLWVGDAVTPSPLLCAAAAFYAVLVVVVRGYQNLFFALDERKTQIRLSVLMATVNVALTIYLLHRVGAEGALIATNISYVVCLILPYSILCWMRLSAKRPSGVSPLARRP